MRFIRGPIPDDPAFRPGDDGWRSIREPDPVWMQVLAVPVMLVTAALLFLAIACCTPISSAGILSKVLVCLVIMLPLHELTHAFTHPAFGMTRQTYLGVWPSKLLFYAHYEGELRRERFLLILAAPLLALTILPLLVCAAFRLNAPWTAALAVANGLGAAGDIVGILLVVTQIPRGASVRNKGWRTYWRPRT